MASTNSNSERLARLLDAVTGSCIRIVTNDDKKYAELRCLVEEYIGGAAAPKIEQCRVRIDAAESFAMFKDMGRDRWAEIFACDERHRLPRARVFWLFEHTCLKIDALGDVRISVEE